MVVEMISCLPGSITYSVLGIVLVSLVLISLLLLDSDPAKHRPGAGSSRPRTFGNPPPTRTPPSDGQPRGGTAATARCGSAARGPRAAALSNVWRFLEGSGRTAWPAP